jgi:hypothetical protein
LPVDLLLERQERARTVLAQMSVVAEGTAMGWDSEGHGQPESRGPVSEESIDRQAERDPGDCPPESRSLYDHWRCRFDRAWNQPERLLYWVLLAEEKLERIRRTPLPTDELPSGSKLTDRIVNSRGSPAEVAARFARFGVTMSHVRRERTIQRKDPETGRPWLWPHESTSGAMTSEARERAKEYAREVALEMWNEGRGESQRRISEATGIPRATLQRMLNPDEAAASRGTVGHQPG